MTSLQTGRIRPPFATPLVAQAHCPQRATPRTGRPSRRARASDQRWSQRLPPIWVGQPDQSGLPNSDTIRPPLFCWGYGALGGPIACTDEGLALRGWAMKGLFTLGIYIAIGITGAAFGQQRMSDCPASRLQASQRTNTPVMAKPSRRSRSPPGWENHGACYADDKAAAAAAEGGGLFGNGGRIDEHRATFEGYSRNKARVELRGPCYSACTLMLGYVERENLCIAPGAFMAFHAARGEILRPHAVAPGDVPNLSAGNPALDRSITAVATLPIDGFWTMYDHALWAMGYPKCKPVGG